MFFLVLLGLVILCGIVYLAVSPQSDFKLRAVALGALALMMMTVIICLVIFFKSEATPKQYLLPDMSPSDLPPMKTRQNIPMLVMLITFVVALFVMIAIMSMREQKRTNGSSKSKEEEESIEDDDSLTDNW